MKPKGAGQFRMHSLLAAHAVHCKHFGHHLSSKQAMQAPESSHCDKRRKLDDISLNVRAVSAQQSPTV